VVQRARRVSETIGSAVAQIALAIIYFAVLTPLGLVLRLFGRDALSLHLDRQRESYWIPRDKPRKPADYFRQF
jgi:hypothetical protein